MEEDRLNTLLAYTRAKSLAVNCAKTACLFPEYERYALADQLRRAAYSTVLNVAEGASRATLPQRRHFLDIARASVREVRVIIDLAADIGYLDTEVAKELQEECHLAAKTIFGYHRSICEKIDAGKRLHRAAVTASCIVAATTLYLLVL